MNTVSCQKDWIIMGMMSLTFNMVKPKCWFDSPRKSCAQGKIFNQFIHTWIQINPPPPIHHLWSGLYDHCGEAWSACIVQVTLCKPDAKTRMGLYRPGQFCVCTQYIMCIEGDMEYKLFPNYSGQVFLGETKVKVKWLFFCLFKK